MGYWIGVVGSKLSYERFINDEYWFCLPNSAEINDKVIMYASTKVSSNNSGIFGIFDIIEKDKEKDCLCKVYGRLSGLGEITCFVKLKKVTFLKNYIDFKSLKNNSFIRNCGFIKRNFQGTYFKINKKEFEVLSKIIGQLE